MRILANKLRIYRYYTMSFSTGITFKLHTLKQTLQKNPVLVQSLKVALTAAIFVVPTVIFFEPFYGITIALGIVAGASADSKDHPKAHLKSLGLTWGIFGFITLSISFFSQDEWLIYAWFLVISFILIVFGGTGRRYKSIGYGGVLVGIYTMLGLSNNPIWYFQPIFLTSGAIVYGLVSHFFLRLHFWRPLKEDLAEGYMALSHYLEYKSKLFYSQENREEKISQLGSINVNVVNALENCKHSLNSYAEIVNYNQLQAYVELFMLLQGLHERATSSTEPYRILAKDPNNKSILNGIGEIFFQLSIASQRISTYLLTGKAYVHPVSIDWIIQALENELQKKTIKHPDSLLLLLHGLNRSHQSLKHFNQSEYRPFLPQMKQEEPSFLSRFKSQFNFNHSRFRYALRLSAAFLVGSLIILPFDLRKGAWILLTTFLVSQMTFSETRKKMGERILGTIIGVMVGILTVQIIPTLSGQTILLIASIFLFSYYKGQRYSVAVLFITTFVLMSNNLIAGTGVKSMLPRLTDTLIGSALAYLAVRLMWPEWQYKRLPLLLINALDGNANYFDAILAEYQPKTPQTDSTDDYEYRRARRQAHKADNELNSSWRSIQLEPKRHQKYRETIYQLSFLNHALLSYLSAFASSKEEAIYSENYQKYYQQINKALHAVGAYLKGESHVDTIDLNPILLELRALIRECEVSVTRQQLRILYNIAQVSNKLLTLSQTLETIKKADS